MRDLERWGLSGALLIADSTGPVLVEYYGLARPASGTPVSEETVFDIASLSKQFTASAVLAAMEDGLLHVADSIGEHLAGVPAGKSAITIHHLLTHTSGLVDPETPRRAPPRTSEEAVAYILALPLESEPGAVYGYSNVGYTLLAAIIQAATGTPYEDYVSTRVFGRAGLRTTDFAWQDSWRQTQVATGIGGYEGGDRSGDPRDRADDWLRRGPGGVLSNVSDLYRWERAMRGGRVLSDEVRRLLYLPHTTAEADFLSYGYGWRIQRTPRETMLAWHTGWDEVFSAVYRRYVDEDVTVIFLSNTSRDLTPVRELVLRSAREGEIGARLFGESGDLAPADGQPGLAPAPRLEAGVFELDGGGRVTLRRQRDTLWISPRNQRGAEALVVTTAGTRAELRDAGARSEALVGTLAAEPGTLAVDLADRIDPYGFAGMGVQDLARNLAVAAARVGGIDSVSTLGTGAAGLPGRTRPVSTVRLYGRRGTADYRVIWFADDEVYVLPGPSTEFERKFLTFEGAGTMSVDLLSRDTTRLVVDGDGFELRAGSEGEWLRARRTTESARRDGSISSAPSPADGRPSSPPGSPNAGTPRPPQSRR